MAAPSTTHEYLELVRKSGVVDEKRVSAFLDKFTNPPALPNEPAQVATLLIHAGLLTQFQADQCLQGKWRRFNIGKYKVLERIGSGGMGSVYLCEHKFMRRRAAVKVLPTSKSSDPAALERFYREARAVAALDHPNIVRAYDIDHEDKLHFLVMEYVDGSSLQEIVRKSGPLDHVRTAHYIYQAALGLQHAHTVAALVHRDIKPGNLIVDRSGTVKILDMGLARFFNDEEDLLTRKYDENVLGTADYLAPEQALDSHTVDIRADIYSLGGTFYYCLTGRTPFSEGTVAQKLIWHQTRQPKPIRATRPEVPEELVAIIDKMMAKDPVQRYQTPLDVAQALTFWVQTEIPPPSESEMPRLSPAAIAAGSLETNPGPISPAPSGPPSSKVRKIWQVSSDSGVQLNSNSQSTPPASSVRSSTSKMDSQLQARPLSTPSAVSTLAPLEETEPKPSQLLLPAAIATPFPRKEEDSIPWEAWTSDTEDPSAKADTAPGPRKKRSAFPLRIVKIKPPSWRGQQRFWWGAASATGVILLGLVVAFWWALSVNSSPRAGSGNQPATLYVNRAGGENVSKTLAEALGKAALGDRIVIADDFIAEQLELTQANKHVTIEADAGRVVVWHCPQQLTDTKQLLVVRDAEGLRLRGITFDGGNRVDQIALLQGDCPGLTMENVRIRGFNHCGILVANCAGQRGKPVSFARVHISTTEERDAAIAFVVNPLVVNPKINRHFRIHDCRFEGPYRTPLQGAEPGIAELIDIDNSVAQPELGLPLITEGLSR